MNQDAAQEIWTMLLWLQVTVPKVEKITGSSKTLGVLDGETKDTFKWLEIETITVVLRQKPATQQYNILEQYIDMLSVIICAL